LKFGSKGKARDVSKDLDPDALPPSVFIELLCTAIDQEAYVV
jgi:hypothetical protein